LTTDGEIAVINLESARRRSWSRFLHDPLREGIAETGVELEQWAAQFLGDVSALDRLEALVRQLVEIDGGSPRTALIQAQVASMTHRFVHARQYLAQADLHLAQADLRGTRTPSGEEEHTVKTLFATEFDGALKGVTS
jgi:hypothetical protein